MSVSVFGVVWVPVIQELAINHSAAEREREHMDTVLCGKPVEFYFTNILQIYSDKDSHMGEWCMITEYAQFKVISPTCTCVNLYNPYFTWEKFRVDQIKVQKSAKMRLQGSATTETIISHQLADVAVRFKTNKMFRREVRPNHSVRWTRACGAPLNCQTWRANTWQWKQALQQRSTTREAN